MYPPVRCPSLPDRTRERAVGPASRPRSRRRCGRRPRCRRCRGGLSAGPLIQNRESQAIGPCAQGRGRRTRAEICSSSTVRGSQLSRHRPKSTQECHWTVEGVQRAVALSSPAVEDERGSKWMTSTAPFVWFQIRNLDPASGSHPTSLPTIFLRPTLSSTLPPFLQQNAFNRRLHAQG